MSVPAVDPAWQLKVNPVPARLRELLSIQPFVKLAADHGVNSSNCPHGYKVDDLLIVHQRRALRQITLSTGQNK